MLVKRVDTEYYRFKATNQLLLIINAQKYTLPNYGDQVKFYTIDGIEIPVVNHNKYIKYSLPIVMVILPYQVTWCYIDNINHIHIRR
jgi:hypothetical protein